MNAVNSVFKRHWKLLVFILGLILVFWFIWALRSVFLPFIVGLLLAYLLLPTIRWVEKRLPGVGKKQQLKRISIVVVIYLFALAVIGLVIFYIVAVMGTSLLAMAQDAPQIIPNGLAAITNWLKSWEILSSPSIQQQIDVYSAQAGVALGTAISEFLTRSVGVVQSSLGMILGFAIMPIFTFYILKDWGRLRDRMYAELPLWSRPHTRNIFAILQNVVGRYVRGQLFLALAVGLCAFVLLMILKIQFALPLAVFAGLTEMVPMIGPWLGGGLAILITLATDPEKVIWVAFGFVVIQLLENNLLVPKIQGSQMHIHPAFIILLSVLGAHFAGIFGFVIVLPLTMIVIGIVKYLRASTSAGSIN
jgi:predicted PurR-regulated permease PerM